MSLTLNPNHEAIDTLFYSRGQLAIIYTRMKNETTEVASRPGFLMPSRLNKESSAPQTVLISASATSTAQKVLAS